MTPPKKYNREECSSHIRPMRDAMEVLGGKWKIPIIMHLSEGPKRFKVMQREIGVSAKMLSKELRDLEVNDLVVRQVFDTRPVTVEYTLAPYGKTLYKVIGSLHDWGTAHRKRVMRRK